MKPDFKDTKFYLQTANLETTETGKLYETPEGIPVTADNYKAETEDIEHIDFVSGLPPFLRGPYGSMYVSRPWTIRQYAGFSTAEESNTFYRRNLEAGQKGLSVAFDLQPIEVMIATTRKWLEMLVKQELLSILSRI